MPVGDRGNSRSRLFPVAIELKVLKRRHNKEAEVRCTYSDAIDWNEYDDAPEGDNVAAESTSQDADNED